MAIGGAWSVTQTRKEGWSQFSSPARNTRFQRARPATELEAEATRAVVQFSLNESNLVFVIEYEF